MRSKKPRAGLIKGIKTFSLLVFYLLILVTIIVHSKACIRNIFNEKKIEIINRSEIVKTVVVKLTYIVNVKHIVYQMIERLER